MEVDKTKIGVIEKLSPPTTIKGIISFLEHWLLQKIYQGLSKITKPLCNLLEREVVFKFVEGSLKAFEKLKEKWVTAHIVAPTYWSLSFEIMSNTSDYSIGAVLHQYLNKLFHTNYYTSKTLLLQKKITLLLKKNYWLWRMFLKILGLT